MDDDFEEPMRPDVMDVFEMLNEFKKTDPIQLKEAGVRNVIFLGRTRTGKSTVFNVLKNPTHIARFGSIFSETRDPCLKSFTVETLGPNKQLTNYTINIIDTPGLFETTVSDATARNNDLLKNAIVTCLDNEITYIHAIFLVCSFDAGVQSQDIEAFHEFVQLFKGAEKHLAILITRAENFTDQRKQSLIDDVRNIPALRDISQQVGDRIFFTGAVTEDVLEDGLSSVKKTVGVVKNLRLKLFQWVFGMEESCQLENLDTFRRQKATAEAQLLQLQKLQKKLEEKKEKKEKSKEDEEEIQKMVTEARLVKVELEKKEVFLSGPNAKKKYADAMRNKLTE